MCGLAGSLVRTGGAPPEREELLRMAAVLRHRGPDQYGLYVDEHVGLAHTRLSIVDLEGGAQPLANENGTVWITFNGEVFNHVELREELLARGHRFTTRSDTEVVVHAFEEWGEDAWLKLNGQFAFALWDTRAARLHLVRDRLGILPLVYSVRGDRVLFASEAKALFATGRVRPQILPRGVAQILTMWSVPAPATLFQGVETVPPGCSVSFDLRLRARERRYWQPDLAVNPASESLTIDDAADRLGELLDNAVRLRLRADVPVGGYLSGGLDSSLITDRIRSAGSSLLRTFAVGFENPAFDERPQQREMAAFLGTDHSEIVCGASDIAASLPDVVWHAESALTRTAPVPLFQLSGLVRDKGMKVVLTGEGADELLAGYGIFKEHKIRRFWARNQASEGRAALLSRLYPYVANSGTGGMWRAAFAKGLDTVDEPFASHRRRWENTAFGLRFLSPEARASFAPARAPDALAATLPDDWKSWGPLARAQTLEMTSFLSPYLLAYQGDRVAMAHGVEVRYPFLDPEVVDFCLALPARLKLCGMRDKRVLRRLASRSLPDSVWSRPKHPYRAPTTTPFFSAGAPDYVDELLSPEALAAQPLVEARTATRLVDKARRTAGRLGGEREEMALVALLTLQLASHHFEGDFAARAAQQRAALDGTAPAVDVNRCFAGLASSNPRSPR